MINVSDLGSFSYCPRLIYLRHVLGILPQPSAERKLGLVSDAIRLEMTLRQARVLDSLDDGADSLDALQRELGHVIEYLPGRYDKVFGWGCAGFLKLARQDVGGDIMAWYGELSAMVEALGIERSQEIMAPKELESFVYSTSLGLSGRVDKIVAGLAPLNVASGAIPTVPWEGDCIKVCAYGMLLEKRYGIRLGHGFIEYARNWRRRPIMLTQTLRTKTVEARDGVLRILDGYVPEVCVHGNPRKCEACSFIEICYRI